MNTYEVTNDSCTSESYEGQRPTETPQDLIAAADFRGMIWPRDLIQLMPVDCPSDCRLCSVDPVWMLPDPDRKRDFDQTLGEYGVEWDPTLKF